MVNQTIFMHNLFCCCCSSPFFFVFCHLYTPSQDLVLLDLFVVAQDREQNFVFYM